MKLLVPGVLSVLFLSRVSMSEAPNRATPERMIVKTKFKLVDFEKIVFDAKQPFTLKEILSATNIVRPWTPIADAKKLTDWDSNLGGTWRIYRIGDGKIKDVCMKGELIRMEEPTLFDVTRIDLGYHGFVQVYRWKEGKYQKEEIINRD